MNILINEYVQRKKSANSEYKNNYLICLFILHIKLIHIFTT